MTTGAQVCVIRLAYNEIAAPPCYFGDAGKTPNNPGPAIKLVDLAAAKLGCKMVWQRKPQRRILRELETNDMDATLALWTLSYDFYVKQGSILKWDGKQFNRKPSQMGAKAGYSIIKDLADTGIALEAN